jgi:hypothetical protein
MAALTRDFKETVRLALDPNFGKELLREGIERVLTGDFAHLWFANNRTVLKGFVCQHMGGLFNGRPQLQLVIASR